MTFTGLARTHFLIIGLTAEDGRVSLPTEMSGLSSLWLPFSVKLEQPISASLCEQEFINIARPVLLVWTCHLDLRSYQCHWNVRAAGKAGARYP
jgi:hypothetical protein